MKKLKLIAKRLKLCYTALMGMDDLYISDLENAELMAKNPYVPEPKKQYSKEAWRKLDELMR